MFISHPDASLHLHTHRHSQASTRTWIDSIDAEQGLIIDGLQKIDGNITDWVAREVPFVQHACRHLSCLPMMAVKAIQQAMEVASPDTLHHAEI